MSFKVTDFGTNRKPICDFLLVINTNSRTVSKLLQIIGQICTFDRGYSASLVQFGPRTPEIYSGIWAPVENFTAKMC